MNKENTQTNTRCEEFRTGSYATMEERMLIDKEIHKELERKYRGDYTAKEYLNLCRENCIEVPIMPPAYGWRI